MKMLAETQINCNIFPLRLFALPVRFTGFRHDDKMRFCLVK
jgi:hypothetical protein